MNSLLGVLLLLLSPAACRTVPADPQGVYVQDGVVASASGSGEGYVQLNVDNDHGQLLLVLHGDKVTAILDGEVLPGERVVREGDKLTVRDVDGEPLFEVRVVEGSHALVYPYDAKAWAVSPDGLFAAVGDSGRVWAPARKRKLIGVTTSPVGAVLCEQLGLKGDEFVIESVNEGMPADLGGVKPLDIVTQIEGEPASTDRLQKVLEDRQPGQEVEITVLRQGESMDLTLVVQEPRSTSGFAYGPEGLGAFGGAQKGWSDMADTFALQELLAARGDIDAERARLADQLAKVESKLQKAKLKHDAQSAQALAELANEAATLEARRAELEAAAAQRESTMSLYQADDASRWLMLPPRSEEASPDRLAQLEERLARLEELLERLAARGVGPEPAPDPAPEPATEPQADEKP